MRFVIEANKNERRTQYFTLLLHIKWMCYFICIGKMEFQSDMACALRHANSTKDKQYEMKRKNEQV